MVQNSNYWNQHNEANSMALTDTLWNKGWESDLEEDHVLVEKLLGYIDFSKIAIADKLRLFLLDQKFGEKLIFNSDFIKEFYEIAKKGNLKRREIYTLLNYRIHFEELGFESIFKDLSDHYQGDLTPYFEAKNIESKELSKTKLRDLVFHHLDLGDYAGGEYSFGPKLFMLCRRDRNYPCLMIMKDARDQLVLNNKGDVWSQKSLGLARRKRPYNVKNGYTPAGIYTMDSVMPSANRQRVYGKFRRVILNFIPRTKDEARMKSLLPESSWSENWWKQAVVARDIGRNLFRIHGTGLKNNNSTSSYYPFVKTSGCIAQRENTYGRKTYKDQRNLLDTMMKASGLEPKYANEIRLKGLLYVVEINGKKAPVEYSDLKELLGL